MVGGAVDRFGITGQGQMKTRHGSEVGGVRAPAGGADQADQRADGTLGRGLLGDDAFLGDHGQERLVKGAQALEAPDDIHQAYGQRTTRRL